MKTITDEMYQAIMDMVAIADRINILADGKKTLEQARQEVLADYDDFADVVTETGIDNDRLLEYGSKVGYWYEQDGKLKVGYLRKYPKFLELFGSKDLVDVSYSDIMKHFSPELYEKFIAEDKMHGVIGEILGHIITENPDITRKLTDSDYALAKERWNTDISGYATVADLAAVVGFEMPTLDEIAEYTYEDDPVELDEVIGAVPDSIKKLVGI